MRFFQAFLLLLMLVSSCTEPVEFINFSYPEGKYKALIMSYDDGTVEDIQLAELFDQYNIIGTFNLNSEFIGTTRGWPLGNGDTTFVEYVPRDSLLQIYKKHEIAAHGALHKNFIDISHQEVLVEVNTDIRVLSELAGREIISMAYPFGNTNDSIARLIATTSISNARTVKDTHDFGLPSDFLKWDPTCHDSKALDHLDAYLNLDQAELSVFYVWGHSWELADSTRWSNMVEFCNKIGNREDIWYTGSGPFIEYLKALERVEVNEGEIRNPEGNQRVWIELSTGKKILEPGEHLKL